MLNGKPKQPLNTKLRLSVLLKVKMLAKQPKLKLKLHAKLKLKLHAYLLKPELKLKLKPK